MKLLAPMVACQDSGTRCFNVRGPLAAASCYKGNRRSLINFAADLLIQQRRDGRSMALLTRKDAEGGVAWMSDAIADLTMEFNKRGVEPFAFHRPGEAIPKGECPPTDSVPLITYGMTGLGDYEWFGGILALHAFHIAPEAIRDAAFGDRPPSARPRIVFRKGRDRILDWAGQVVSQEDRRKAELMLFRLELDATAQAVHRVRPGIHPRLVITNIRAEARPLLGAVTEVKNLGELRVRLKLPQDTRGARREDQARKLGELVAKGVPISSAAEQLGIGRTKAQELRREFGSSWEVPFGRPTKPPS